MDSFFLDAATLSGNAGLAPSSPVGGQNLLLVDSSVTNYQYFVNSAANNAQVFLLNSQEDGVAQISAILASYTNIASLQIISHGDSGSLNLGNTTLKSWDNYTNDLAGWGKALSPDADILFFGCNVAQGEQGQRFVSELSTLTGADVAASDDLTGLGGDWVLEFATGSIETSMVFDPSTYDGTLNTLVTANQVANTISLYGANGSGGFGAPTTLAAGGTSPNTVALGDINGDGLLDIVSGNSGSGNISLFLNNGTGGFSAPQTFATNGNPTSLILADVNKDGRLDAIAQVRANNRFAVLLNNGMGGFSAQQSFTSGATPFGIAAIDVNSDGNLDIITSNSGNNTVTVNLGNGTGSFAAVGTSVAIGTSVQDMTVGDLNNDGRMDFVTANRGARNVTVGLGNGTGGFSVANFTVSNTDRPNAVAVGDLNGDGFSDIAVALTGSTTTGNPLNTVAILLNSGTGSFGTATAVGSAASTQQNDIVIRDINGDTFADLVISSPNGNQIALLTGNGTGGFTAQTPLATTAAPYGLAFGSFGGSTPPADTTAPVLQSATVNGSTVVLTYNETLDGVSDPAGSAYTVTVNGVQRTVNNVDANGTTVTLTLASAVSAGETVVLNYAVPATNPVQDVAGNDAIVLTNQSVTNNTPSTGGTDTTAPVLVNAVVTGHLLTSGVKLIYNERLDGAADPNPNNYTVLVNGVARGVTGVNVQPGIGAEGTTVLLTLSSQVLQGDVVTVSYTPGSIAVQDIAGNDAASFTNLNVANLRNFALDYSFMRVRDVFDFTQFGYTYDRGYVTGFNTLPTTATQRTGLATRKNAIDMTPEEIDAYINAILTLKETTVLSPNGIEISIYDQMVAAHIATGDAGGRQAPDGTTMANPAHGGPGFMPWHRLLLAEYEDALQAVNPTVTLPYWDWTNVNGTINTVLQDNFMGSGTGGTISSGYFSLANGWAVRNDLSDGRWLGVDATPESFGRNLGLRVQNPGTWATNLTSILASSAFTPFANGVERGTGAHNNAHGYIGGIMSNVAASPNDPIFWMLHSNVDRLWAEWQVNNHWGTGFYAADGQNYGHDLDDPLFLWDNGAIPIAADLRDILPRGINGSPGNIINGNTTVTGSVTNTGVVTPGNSPGTVIIEGDYTQSSEGKLTIEIAGLEQGHQYDFLKVDGTASLDGTLNLYFPGDFDPSHQTFVFLSAANIEGDFSEINVFGLDTPLEYSLYKSADNTSYTLEFFGAADTSTTNYGIAQTRADLFEDTDLSLYNPFFGQGIDMYIYGLGHHHGWGFDGEDAIVDHAPSTTDWYLSYDVNVNEWIATLEQGGSVPDEYRSPDAHDHGGDHGTGGGTTDDHECCEECDHGTDSGMTDDHTHHDHDHGTDGGTANGGTANDHDHEHCDDHGTDGTTDDHTHHDHDHDHGTDGGTANGGTTNDHDHEHCDDHGSDGGMTDDHTHHDHDHDHDHGTDSGTTDDHAHHDHDHHDHGTGDTTSSPTPETIAPSPVPSETPSSIPSLGVFTVGSTGQVIFDFLADCGAYQGELAIFNLSAVANLVPGSAEFIAAAARSAQVIFGTEAGARFRGNLGETSQAHGSYNGQKVFTFTPGDQLVLMLVPNGTLADVLAGEVRPLFSVAAANPDAKEHLGLLISTHDNSVTLGWEDLSTEQGSDFDFNDFVFHIHGVGGKASDLAQLVAGNRAWLNTQFAQELIAFCKNNECVDPGTVGDAHDHSTHDHSDHNHADSEQSIASESSELDTTADHSHSHGDTTEAAVTDSSTSTEPHTTDSGHSEDCHTDESVDSADLSDSHGDSHSDLTMVTLPTSDPHAEDTIVPLPGAHPEDCEEHSTQETALAEVLPEVPDSSSSAHEIGVILNGQDTNLEETEDCECCAETTEALPEEQTSEATEEHDHAHHHHE